MFQLLKQSSLETPDHGHASGDDNILGQLSPCIQGTSQQRVKNHSGDAQAIQILLEHHFADGFPSRAVYLQDACEQ